MTACQEFSSNSFVIVGDSTSRSLAPYWQDQESSCHRRPAPWVQASFSRKQGRPETSKPREALLSAEWSHPAAAQAPGGEVSGGGGGPRHSQFEGLRDQSPGLTGRKYPRNFHRGSNFGTGLPCGEVRVWGGEGEGEKVSVSNLKWLRKATNGSATGSDEAAGSHPVPSVPSRGGSIRPSVGSLAEGRKEASERASKQAPRREHV